MSVNYISIKNIFSAIMDVSLLIIFQIFYYLLISWSINILICDHHDTNTKETSLITAADC